jgi:hypothetical protein
MSLVMLSPIASQAGSTKPKKPALTTETTSGQTQMLQPDGIATYDQSRLPSVDGQVKSNMQNQQQNTKVKNQVTGAAVNPQNDPTSGAELNMIRLQSLQSQRQNTINETTQMIQGTQCQKCAQNIGN